MLLEIKVTLSIPELVQLGEQVMAGLQELRDAITTHGTDIGSLLQTIATELEQLGQREVIHPEDVTALATMVRDQSTQLKDAATQIAGMVPDAPPTP